MSHNLILWIEHQREDGTANPQIRLDGFELKLLSPLLDLKDADIEHLMFIVLHTYGPNHIQAYATNAKIAVSMTLNAKWINYDQHFSEDLPEDYLISGHIIKELTKKLDKKGFATSYLVTDLMKQSKEIRHILSHAGKGETILTYKTGYRSFPIDALKSNFGMIESVKSVVSLGAEEIDRLINISKAATLLNQHQQMSIKMSSPISLQYTDDNELLLGLKYSDQILDKITSGKPKLNEPSTLPMYVNSTYLSKILASVKSSWANRLEIGFLMGKKPTLFLTSNRARYLIMPLKY